MWFPPTVTFEEFKEGSKKDPTIVQVRSNSKRMFLTCSSRGETTRTDKSGPVLRTTHIGPLAVRRTRLNGPVPAKPTRRGRKSARPQARKLLILPHDAPSSFPSSPLNPVSCLRDPSLYHYHNPGPSSLPLTRQDGPKQERLELFHSTEPRPPL